jgi:hypothetical protein
MATRRQPLEALESTLAPNDDHGAYYCRPVVLDPKLGPRLLETIRMFKENCDGPIDDWPAERERILAHAREIWERRRAGRAAEPPPLDG